MFVESSDECFAHFALVHVAFLFFVFCSVDEVSLSFLLFFALYGFLLVLYFSIRRQRQRCLRDRYVTHLAFHGTDFFLFCCDF